MDDIISLLSKADPWFAFQCAERERGDQGDILLRDVERGNAPIQSEFQLAKAVENAAAMAKRLNRHITVELGGRVVYPFVCPTCTYPSRLPACDNPGCCGNPNVSAEQKAAWQATADKAAAEKAERDRLAAIRCDPTGANAERDRAQAAFAKLSANDQAAYRAAWVKADSEIRAAKPKTGKKWKVYEMHHLVEHGRRRFLAALTAGQSPDECAAAAIAA